MIIDTIENISRYEPIITGISEGIKRLSAITGPEEGKYEFNGGFLTIQSGETKDLNEGTFELHRKYIDVQIMLEGCEEIAWSSAAKLKTMIPYNAETDIERLDGTKEHHILISKGMFYAVFPEDGHKAVSHTKELHRYKKAVIKIPVSAKVFHNETKV